jgi:hypothetical protein
MRNLDPTRILGLALALLLLVGPQAVQAQKKPTTIGAEVSVQVRVTFSAREREQITTFFSQHRPADLKPLPPGIRKNLARGKPLPPGIAKQTLPPELVRVLPERSGYEVVQVGWDVVLVEVATGVIRDVLMDVIR